uniref:Uncharacterized protein LOC100179141 n=1 Tax=Phallusia mammillata TaxID=59560 RepID=A0A6F9DHM7_9ASCI|nr:uncharacterized protein LOC100179141 [Phallusia mammillata]
MTPYQALKEGLDLDQIIDTATSMRIKNIIKFEDIEDEVRNQIENKSMYAGVPWKRFESLTKKLKGHRRGELTVITGTTGCGKTTLVSEMSLDLAIQGVTTLWGSFEINNTRLMKCMLQQFSKVQL